MMFIVSKSKKRNLELYLRYKNLKQTFKRSKLKKMYMQNNRLKLKASENKILNSLKESFVFLEI